MNKESKSIYTKNHMRDIYIYIYTYLNRVAL